MKISYVPNIRKKSSIITCEKLKLRVANPHVPYWDLDNEQDPQTPYSGSQDTFNQSSQVLPLVANASPFQHTNIYKYDKWQSLHSKEFDGRSRLTSARDDTMSLGTVSYAPSWYLFQNVDKKALLEKEALPGKIHEGEVAEVFKKTCVHQQWTALCWLLLTWWVLSSFLQWIRHTAHGAHGHVAGMV